MANFVGTAGDDVITGTAGDDVIDGGDGADVIDGGAGNDILASAYRLTPYFTGYYAVTNAPPPLLDWGTEHDRVTGGDGSDVISVGYGDDADGGTSFNSNPESGTRPDTDQLYLSLMGATAGITADFHQATLTIGGGTITNFEVIQLVQGSNFDDTLIAGDTTYRLFGMGGNDRLVGGAVTQSMDGGDGDDVLDAAKMTINYGPLTLYGGVGNDLFIGMRSINVQVYGGDGDDLMRGTGTFFGGSGNDRVEAIGGVVFFGEAGDDILAPASDNTNPSVVDAFGGSGADSLTGSNYADTLGSADELVPVLPIGSFPPSGIYRIPGDDVGLEHDVIKALGGDDVVGGGYGDDLNGGDGYDRLRYSFGGQQAGVTFDANAIANGKALVIGGGTIQGFEALVYLRTTDFDDTITLATQVNSNPGPYNGKPGDELIEVQAGGGNDVIVGADSAAYVFGGAGNDRFVSGKASDTFDGGDGTDTIDYSTYGASVSVSLAQGTGADGDRLISVENAIGSAFDDQLTGSAAANVLTGGAGRDTLTGGGGIDTFRDTLSGHNGDTITDLQNGESIVFTDATLDSFTYSVSGNTLTYSGGTITLNGFSSVTFAAAAAAGGGVSLTLSASVVSNQIFNSPTAPLIANFNTANGWTSQDLYPRYAADVSGDGRADIVGFGAAGVLVAANLNGSFGQPSLALANFGQQQGWTSDNQFHRALAEANGDGRADIIGFGQAGTLISLAKTDGSFGTVQFGLDDFGQAQGWTSQDGYARIVGDVNGDGKADIVGFGVAGTLVALGNGDGTFREVDFGLDNFGTDQGWRSQNQYTRALADVNGDGKLDIVAFGVAGTYVALSNGDGSFADAKLALSAFGASQGWSANDSTPRLVADINGDHFADIVGFTSAGTVVALGNGDGTFQAPRADVAAFGAAQGWTSDNATPRELADLNGDGFLDIVGFGSAGVVAATNHLGAMG